MSLVDIDTQCGMLSWMTSSRNEKCACIPASLNKKWNRQFTTYIFPPGTNNTAAYAKCMFSSQASLVAVFTHGPTLLMLTSSLQCEFYLIDCMQSTHRPWNLFHHRSHVMSLNSGGIYVMSSTHNKLGSRWYIHIVLWELPSISS